MSGRSRSTWVDPIGVALVQTRLEMGDPEGNLSRAREMIRASADEKRPDLVVLPEAFSTGFDYNRLPEIAERAPSVARELGEIAGELRIRMMFTQVVTEGSNYYNRAVVLDDDGSVVCTYDKTHLFSRAGEDDFLTAGSSHAAFDLKGATVSPLICYEVRYPEMARALVLNGAHILVYMAQWPAFRISQWNLLLRARALENQCFVVGVNICGPHGDTEMGGHSAIISPFGNVITSLDAGESWAVGVLEPEELYKFRRDIPCLDGRRPDLYGEIFH